MPTAIAHALGSVKPFEIPGSRARYYLRDIGLRDVDDREVFVGTLGAAAGQTYTGLDEATGVEQTIELEKRKVASHATFLIDSAGNLIHEVRSTYLKASQVRSAIDIALRKGLGAGTAFTLDPRPLEGSARVMRDWIESLDELATVQFTNLRHSNPHPPIPYIDDLTTAMVDELVQSSSKPGGIAKDSVIIQDTLDHAQRYGRISNASGRKDGVYETIEQRDEEIQLKVAVDSEDKFVVMFRLLRRYTKSHMFKR